MRNEVFLVLHEQGRADGTGAQPSVAEFVDYLWNA
jgi:hypothetical protein